MRFSSASLALDSLSCASRSSSSFLRCSSSARRVCSSSSRFSLPSPAATASALTPMSLAAAMAALIVATSPSSAAAVPVWRILPSTNLVSASSATLRAAASFSSSASRSAAPAMARLPGSSNLDLPTPMALAALMALRSSSMSSPWQASAISSHFSSRASRMTRTLPRAFMPRAAACSLPATPAMAWLRSALRLPLTPSARKIFSLPSLNSLPVSLSLAHRSAHLAFWSPEPLAMPPTKEYMPLNSSKGMRSG
mmetsp:Transcript_23309/g.55515  ORF Transcript_23309/g.55515 Transcript_23309/m.55515 type:complete len:253 (-) Transcript_23309:1902-2660(-)